MNNLDEARYILSLGMMQFLLVSAQLLFGAMVGYLAATLSESAFHRLVGHASPSQLRRWRKLPRFFAPFILSHFRHGIIHHRHTFRANFVTQFTSRQEKDNVTAFAHSRGDQEVDADDCNFGLTIGWLGFLYFNLMTLPFLPLVALHFGLVCALAYAAMLGITPSLSRWIHPLLHQDLPTTRAGTPTVLGLLMNSSYFRAVRRHHYLHHKYLDCNFNLLLGGDWLLGVHRSPSPTDLDAMSEIGIR